MKDRDIGQFIVGEPEASQAVLLLTNRLVVDLLSFAVDSGALSRTAATNLIRFSASEVSKGSPQLSDAVGFFADLTIGRLPD